MAQSEIQHITDYPPKTFGGLERVMLFSNLSVEELACFHNASQTLSYKKGKILYLQGEPAKTFYVIFSGWIKLFHTMPQGEEVIVDMLTSNNIVGESAIFDHGCYTSSAEIVGDVHLLRMPLKLLKEQIHTNPKLAFNMLTSMSQHHRRQYGALAFNITQNAPQRIGCFLLSLCPNDKERDIVFHLPFDKTLVADVLGMNGATFSRSLNIIRQKAGVNIKGTCVEIGSMDKLSKFVYGPLTSKYAPEKI